MPCLCAADFSFKFQSLRRKINILRMRSIHALSCKAHNIIVTSVWMQKNAVFTVIPETSWLACWLVVFISVVRPHVVTWFSWIYHWTYLGIDGGWGFIRIRKIFGRKADLNPAIKEQANCAKAASICEWDGPGSLMFSVV